MSNRAETHPMPMPMSASLSPSLTTNRRMSAFFQPPAPGERPAPAGVVRPSRQALHKFQDGEQERGQRKTGQQGGRESWLRACIVHQVVDRLDFNHRLIRIDAGNLCSDRLPHALRRDRGSNQQIHVSPRQLREGQIKLRLRILRQAMVLNIGGDSDHFCRLRPAANNDMFSDRILIGPIAACKGLIRNDHLRTLRVIGQRKATASSQRTRMVLNHSALTASISMNGRFGSGTSGCPPAALESLGSSSGNAAETAASRTPGNAATRRSSSS